MTPFTFRRAILAISGAFILAASPLHSASLDPAVAMAADGPGPVASGSVSEPHQSAPVFAASIEPASVPVPVFMPLPVPQPPAEFDVDLAPGEFVWLPEQSTQGAVEIVVSLPLQRIYVYRGGALIGLSTVSTGRPGHETPPGSFTILQKHREHYSSLYNNAPMPFMQRLTWDGIALHAGQIPGRPASHGCVRLPLAFSRHLFGVTQMGAAVHIIEQSPAPVEALAMVRGNSLYQGMGGPEEEEAAPTR